VFKELERIGKNYNYNNMKEIIKRLFHAHKWLTINHDVRPYYFNGKEEGNEYVYIQECQVCGKMRCYKFK